MSEIRYGQPVRPWILNRKSVTAPPNINQLDYPGGTAPPTTHQMPPITNEDPPGTDKMVLVMWVALILVLLVICGIILIIPKCHRACRRRKARKPEAADNSQSSSCGARLAGAHASPTLSAPLPPRMDARVREIPLNRRNRPAGSVDMEMEVRRSADDYRNMKSILNAPTAGSDSFPDASLMNGPWKPENSDDDDSDFGKYDCNCGFSRYGIARDPLKQREHVFSV